MIQGYRINIGTDATQLLFRNTLNNYRLFYSPTSICLHQHYFFYSATGTLSEFLMLNIKTFD